MADSRRERVLSDRQDSRGSFVLYWMQAAVRVRFNPALERAVELANDRNLPLSVVFCLDQDYPDANLRHYTFLLQGLRDASAALSEIGLGLDVFTGSPAELIPVLSRRADMVVTDAGYTGIQRRWRARIAAGLEVPMLEVETEAVVPLRLAADKDCWSAAVLRRRIQPLLDSFLVPEAEYEPRFGFFTGFQLPAAELPDEGLPDGFGVDAAAGPVCMRGGCRAADRQLEDFIENRLDDYESLQRDPSLGGASGLSAWLHFGHVSPVGVALGVLGHGGPGVDAFLEQLVIRRELAMNFCFYNPLYDSYDGLPSWARDTLDAHASDPRPALYDRAALEAAASHDPCWNAAQLEMVKTGFMHNYMRMYWGKKILEWSRTPRDAFETALYLNNKYLLDGRDPNGYAGVAWCFGKHDRPWKERAVFGKIRYMNENGLRRKFDIDKYIGRIAEL